MLHRRSSATVGLTVVRHESLYSLELLLRDDGFPYRVNQPAFPHGFPILNNHLLADVSYVLQEILHRTDAELGSSVVLASSGRVRLGAVALPGVKYEEVYLKAYQNGTEARQGIGAYLSFYNRERPHQTLGYRTPGQVFEEGQPARQMRQQWTGFSSGLVLQHPAGDSLNLASLLSK